MSLASKPRRRLERMRDVIYRTGLSRSEIYRRIKAGRFPRPVRLGRAVAFPAEEIDAWIVDLIEQRGEASPGTSAETGEPFAGSETDSP